ncbi:acyl-CoA dehydrogenase family protein [Salinibacterium sp. TMP30]|uniref:acyl-CoA dehydrogenase family protein n=1 Tax=Salinibacterium sp. TMP30 TaxID=3138237 RepID=UPI00313998EF
MNTTFPVRITASDRYDGMLDEVGRRALDCDGKVDAALQLAVTLGATVPLVGAGSTATLWSALATVAAADVTVARVVEPHLDALAILSQAKPSDLDRVAVAEDSTWGVFAAESPEAQLDAAESADGWKLTGTKAWCSLAGSLSHALITAHTGGSSRRLFAVALDQPGVVVREGEWHANGLSAIASGAVDFTTVDAVPVGEDGWYFHRPGFAWGGIGVAACWWGGAVGIARRAFDAARDREPDQVALMHLGALDVALYTARVALATAAETVDDPATDRDAAKIVAHRTRTVAARVSEEVIERVGHALGPGPLSLEPDHARRVADLQLYVRQHHAERDDVALARKLLESRAARW